MKNVKYTYKGEVRTLRVSKKSILALLRGGYSRRDIDRSFCWGDTPQGHSYWSDLKKLDKASTDFLSLLVKEELSKEKKTPMSLDRCLKEKRFSPSNNYGGAKTTKDLQFSDIWEESYVCHSQVSNLTGCNTLFFSCVYNTKTSYKSTKLQQARYFEYMLSSKTSPFRDLIKKVEDKVHVVYKDKFPHYVILEDVQNWNISFPQIMMWMKSLRQCLEGKDLQYFTYALDNYTSDQKIWEALFISLLFRSNGDNLTVADRGDHTLFKDSLSKELLNRELDVVIKKVSSTYSYMSTDMSKHCFKTGGRIDTGWFSDISKLKVCGYLYKVGGVNVYTVPLLIKNHEALIHSLLTYTRIKLTGDVKKGKGNKAPSYLPITWGADPEFFLTKDGEFIPAYLSGVKGTKEKPQKLKNGGYVQVDGMALEINVPPSDTIVNFVVNFRLAMVDVMDILPKGFEISNASSATFSKKVFDKTPKEFKILGCDPDYDAQTQESKTPPAGSDSKPYRTAGGHIHIGFCKGADPDDAQHIYDCAKSILHIESIFTGGTGMVLGGDPDKERQKLYGQVGSFRPKSYGVEWRTPSNWWISFSDIEIYTFLAKIESSLYPNLKRKNHKSQLTSFSEKLVGKTKW